MSADQKPLLGIPTNVISGFLGVGKTSAILNLLSQKDLIEALEKAERRIKREKKEKEKQKQANIASAQ